MVSCKCLVNPMIIDLTVTILRFEKENSEQNIETVSDIVREK